MKIKRVDLGAPFNGDGDMSRVGVHRQMDETAHNFATMSLSGGPVRVDLTLSRDELRKLAWDTMQAVVSFEEGRDAIMEDVRAIILKQLPIEPGEKKAG